MAVKRTVVHMAAVLAAGCVALAASPAPAAVVGREVTYAVAGTTLKGYFASDTAVQGRRPGVLVVHEWWGHTEYARRRARMLAELGYAALAVDMYGDGKTAAHPDDAGKFSGELMKSAETATARFLAAREFLAAQPETDPARIAAIGYCMGGGVVLNMARAGVDLRGVASFHGSLNAIVPPAAAGGIKARLLVLHGEADTFVPADVVAAFKKEMADAKADLRFVAYPGVKHSFTNPEADEYAKKFGMPLAYDAEADRLSWEELKAFLARVFA